MNFKDIPKKLIEQYRIVKTTDGIDINNPSYINVNNPEYEMNNIVLRIKNNNVCVSLWVNVHEMHTTVY